MNPAPRTTEEEWEEWPKKWLVRADLARELETELTEARAQLLAALEKTHRLSSLWNQFFFLLDILEESDSGTEFRPNRISSCRALDSERMEKILAEAKQLVNAGVKN